MTVTGYTKSDLAFAEKFSTPSQTGRGVSLFDNFGLQVLSQNNIG